MIRKLIREPLFHFIVIGGLLFLIFGLRNDAADSEDSYDIHLDQSDINRLISTYQMSWNKAPDDKTLAHLIDSEVESEIYYREAKRLQLHHNDEIIKRRLKQKYEFLVKDMLEQVEPTTSELQEFYHENKEGFATDAEVSFEHYYFQDREDLSPYLTELKNNNLSEISAQSFHINKIQKNKTQGQLAQNFGSAFAKSLFGASDVGWLKDPVSSGFGLHLVNVTGFKTPITPELSDIKSKVTEAWKEKQRIDYNKRLYSALKANYNIEVVNTSAE